MSEPVPAPNTSFRHCLPALPSPATLAVRVSLLHRLTPLVTALISARILGTVPQAREWAALLLIVLGALCYLAGDPSFSWRGYVWMLINLVSAAAYHVYVKATINLLEPTTIDLVLWNNLLSLPLLAVLGLLLDDPIATVDTVVNHVSTSGWAALGASVLFAGQIGFAGFMLQALVSPTSATLVNHAVKVASFIASYALYRDRLTGWMVAGVVLTLVGTIAYSRAGSAGAARPAAAAMTRAPALERFPAWPRAGDAGQGKAAAPKGMAGGGGGASRGGGPVSEATSLIAA